MKPEKCFPFWYSELRFFFKNNVQARSFLSFSHIQPKFSLRLSADSPWHTLKCVYAWKERKLFINGYVFKDLWGCGLTEISGLWLFLLEVESFHYYFYHEKKKKKRVWFIFKSHVSQPSQLYLIHHQGDINSRRLSGGDIMPKNGGRKFGNESVFITKHCSDADHSR